MQLLLSLQKQYESSIIEADYQIKLLVNKTMSVAGHSNHKDDLDKWLEVKSENTEKLKEVLGYLPKPEKAKKEDKKDGK